MDWLSDVGADVTLDEDRHEYRFMGQIVPSVTQVLQPFVDFSGIPHDVLMAKRDLGQRVHLACQLDDEDDLDESSVEADVEPYLDGWRRFKHESGAIVLLNEKLVCAPLMLYAGKLDRVLMLNGHKWLIDLKTSISLPLAVGPQTAAYLRALGDATVTHRGALRLQADGRFKLDPLTDPDDWSVFMSLLTIKHFREKHARS